MSQRPPGEPPAEPNDGTSTDPLDADGDAADAMQELTDDQTVWHGDTEVSGSDRLPLDEIITERPAEVAVPLRGPLALGWAGIVGVLMGAAEVVPGFSGGTVALVTGIYERLIANIRQGARVLSLLIRGRVADALRGLSAIEWPFVGILLIGMFAAIFSLASWLQGLIDDHPTLLKAALIGLVLGASVLAARELRAPSPLHVLLGVVLAFGVFFGLGASGGPFVEPTLLWIFLGGAIAICAWILPGISGSFILLMLGLWPTVVGAVADRDLIILLVLILGCVVGLAIFSTALNWLLARYHDLALAALIGMMVGSVRALWPYPSDAPFENVELGAPEGTDALLALAVGLVAFTLVWVFGLVTAELARRRDRRRSAAEDIGATEPSDPEGWGPPAGERPPSR